MSRSSEYLPNSRSLTALIESMREGRLDIMSDGGRPVTVVEQIGEGGSKTIYDVDIESQRYALALPNIVDDAEIMLAKWKVVLQEPVKTERVRHIGLPVNTVCESFPVQVNGAPFPALLMARYQDLPFEVRDTKNPNTSIWKTPILAGKILDAQSLQVILRDATSDLSTMIRNGVQVMRDSMNLCIDRGQLRIFLNDLGSASFERISTGDRQDCAKTYCNWAVGAFLNALTEPEYQTNKRFFDDKLSGDTAEGYYQALSQEVLRSFG